MPGCMAITQPRIIGTGTQQRLVTFFGTQTGAKTPTTAYYFLWNTCRGGTQTAAKKFSLLVIKNKNLPAWFIRAGRSVNQEINYSENLINFNSFRFTPCTTLTIYIPAI